jgi:hypothetical protein
LYQDTGCVGVGGGPHGELSWDTEGLPIRGPDLDLYWDQVSGGDLGLHLDRPSAAGVDPERGDIVGLE